MLPDSAILESPVIKDTCPETPLFIALNVFKIKAPLSRIPLRPVISSTSPPVESSLSPPVIAIVPPEDDDLLSTKAEPERI